jgi:uncharacterized MAPEG superfamily protein
MFAAASGSFIPRRCFSTCFVKNFHYVHSFLQTRSMTLPLELKWLAYVTLATAMMWLPYTLALILHGGLGAAMGNRDLSPERPQPLWAQRAKRAHANAVENLAVFAPLVLIASVSHVNSSLAVLCAQIYLVARLAHYVIYCVGIPVIRTLAFFAGWGATLALGISIISIHSI